MYLAFSAFLIVNSPRCPILPSVSPLAVEVHCKGRRGKLDSYYSYASRSIADLSSPCERFATHSSLPLLLLFHDFGIPDVKMDEGFLMNRVKDVRGGLHEQPAAGFQFGHKNCTLHPLHAVSLP